MLGSTCAQDRAPDEAMAVVAATGMIAPPAHCMRVAAIGTNRLVSTFKGISLGLHSSGVSPLRACSGRAAAPVTVCKFKLKTHKATAKRFRVTGSGVIMRRRAGKQHLLVGKSTKRRKRLSKMVPVSRRDYTGICRAMPYLRVKRRHVLRSARRPGTTVTAPAPASSPDPAASAQETSTPASSE